MQTYALTGDLLARMVQSGAQNLRNNAQIVNDLNVFPIPDGDTGENMSLTMEGGATAVCGLEGTLEEISGKMATGMLLNARGNSGVILSQFFGGISKGWAGAESADLDLVKSAFASGVKQAYSAVITPTEGTILTVAREATDYASQHTASGEPLEKFFSNFLREAKKSLKRTPDLLACLKEAGVIDSGGAGLIYIFEGMQKALGGKPVVRSAEETLAKPKYEEGAMKFDENSELTFGYCTECLLQLQHRKCDIDAFDTERMIADLEKMGNSIVCVKAGSVVKLHIHTMEPGSVFNYCQQYGEFLTLKVENMNLQNTHVHIQNRFVGSADEEDSEEESFDAGAIVVEKAESKKRLATVVCASGEGIQQAFVDMGADAIVNGGQTNNPSTEDFLSAFRLLNAENIVVFPNNSNIILAAKQAGELYKDAKVFVFESKSIGEGYAALSMLDPDLDSMEDILEGMREASKDVKTGHVTYSVRDAHLNGLDIGQGDYIGYVDKEMLSDAKDATQAAILLLDRMQLENHSVLICVRGKDATVGQSEQIRDHLAKTQPELEFYEIDGKQDVYNFILIAE